MRVLLVFKFKVSTVGCPDYFLFVFPGVNPVLGIKVTVSVHAEHGGLVSGLISLKYPQTSRTID